MFLLLLSLPLFSEIHNKASFIAVSSAVKIVISSVNLTSHLNSNSGMQKAADVLPSGVLEASVYVRRSILFLLLSIFLSQQQL